jgi:hypothetical protein
MLNIPIILTKLEILESSARVSDEIKIPNFPVCALADGAIIYKSWNSIIKRFEYLCLKNNDMYELSTDFKKNELIPWLKEQKKKRINSLKRQLIKSYKMRNKE